MRIAFYETLTKLKQDKSNMFLLTGDLGFKLFDGFKEKFPAQFFDVGIAESNMVGLASGMALSGKNVYCYSITPFLTVRALEQIRIDIAYHNLNVKLVGVGGGFAYGLEGITHFGLEDFSVMRALHNMTIVCPADPREAEAIAKLSYNYSGPMYIRLGQNGDPIIHNSLPDLEIGKALTLNEGKDVAIYAIGSMVHVGKQVLKMMKKEGYNATLINMHTLKPLDVDNINQIASTHSAIFSLEEHNVHGGLGSALAEVLAEKGFGGLFRRVGIPEKLEKHKYMGKAGYLRDIYGLTPEKVYSKIINELTQRT